MSSSVLVDTSEVEGIDANDAPVVVNDGNEMVMIDTLQSDLDKLVAAPPSPAGTPPVPMRRPTPIRPARTPSASIASPAKPPAPVKKMPDAQAAYQEALKKTVLPPPSSQVPAVQQQEVPVPTDDITFPDEPRKLKNRRRKHVQQEEEEEEEAAGPPPTEEEEEPDEDDEGEEEEEEEDEEGEAKAEEVDDRDEDTIKMELLKESRDLMADGFIPFQQPVFSMNLPTLKKIVEQQEQQAAEEFGINLLGFGWIEVIRLIETINHHFDPAGRFLGKGKSLRLDGSADMITKKIRRYRGPFRYLWRKMNAKKLEEFSPLITMGLITFDILKNVHINNVRTEMRKAAEETMRQPPPKQTATWAAGQPTDHQAQETVNMPPLQPPVPGEEERTPPSAVTTTQVEPAPAQMDQPEMESVDSIVIPESDSEAPQASDEVVVHVPEPGRKRRRGGKKASN